MTVQSDCYRQVLFIFSANTPIYWALIYEKVLLFTSVSQWSLTFEDTLQGDSLGLGLLTNTIIGFFFSNNTLIVLLLVLKSLLR